MKIERLKEIRKITGLKQMEMAERVGYDQCNFSNIENGRSIPKNMIDIKVQICEILQVETQNKARELKLKFEKEYEELMNAFAELNEVYPILLNAQENGESI